jgi:hypothetical protein
MSMTATRLAKHAAIFVFAILAGVAAGHFYAVMCMFSDEKELACTDASQQFVGAAAFLTVAAFIYGLRGMVRLVRSTLVQT